MNPNEMKVALIEALRECNPVNPAQSHRKGLEFSKWLMVFAVVICGGTWVVAAASWLMWREYPAELVQFTTWFFGALIAYMLKSGYENKSKIERERGDS
jgi:hypothetical protein